jgi:hypothetical protein
MKVSPSVVGDVIVVIIGIAVAFTIGAEWFIVCCLDSDAIGLLLYPAMMIASISGNGMHNAGGISFTAGLVLDLLVVWWLLKFLFFTLLRRARRL